jgi:transposase-like protein
MRHGGGGQFAPQWRNVSQKRWKKYSPEFREQALERMKTCTNVMALARELGIRRKWLYKWAEGREGYVGFRQSAAKERSAEEIERDNERLKKKLVEMERLAGQQAAELDFFRGALRRIKGLRQNSTNSGGTASTNKSES